ncbi:MAG: tRNA dihydrouridine(20/20a) synthase DusA [Pseudomonadota bacterium]
MASFAAPNTASSSLYAKHRKPIFAVAPMMDWTDRHCRYFHRLLTKSALLYTEMVVADAIVHGDVERHLAFDASEHPLAVQLGGSDPAKLAHVAQICERWGYDEVNLNVGCPSDRVQSGTFGACLMREPDLVADCVAAMKDVVSIPVTVKCRIGVDEQDVETALDRLADAVFAKGCDGLWVHARKAWLQGLSPKENRDIPPLDYDRVHRLKARLPHRFIGINGGIARLEDGLQHLDRVDGIMLGRSAYQNPSLLMQVDEHFGKATLAEPISMDAICEAMMAYAAAHIAWGGRLHHVSRHMIGLFQGQPGARRYRQILSTEAVAPDADERVLSLAFQAMDAVAA